MKQSAKRSHHVSDFTISHLAVLAGLMLTLLMFAAPAPAAERSSTNFNHLTTGFPLTGAHAQANCQTCHARGVFKGTPRQCEFCHAQGSRMASTAKPTNHVQTTQPCDQCHNNTVTWAGARFRHTGIIPGNCMTCHNNNTASGKPANHMQTTAACDTCHRTTAWIPASFRHTNVTPGSCATCHNGSNATGKPGNHVQTTAACDTCHRTTAWIPASFNHTSVTPGSCATCHNGSTATGKPSNHVQTTAACDTCHRTTAWIPATFSHTSVTPGSCATCHNGSTGKRQAQQPRADHRLVRRVPPHHGLAPGDLQSHHRDSRQLRHLPQRQHRNRQARHTLRHHAFLRRLSYHYELDNGALHTHQPVLQHAQHWCHLPWLPRGQQRSDCLEIWRLLRILRGLSCR